MPIIIDGNKVVETPVRDILSNLQQQLQVCGSDKLQNIQYNQSNARVCCPIHKDGHERTPSCDILLCDRRGVNAGTVHCFGCGYTANITKFVQDCLNTSFRSATDWLLGFVDYSFISDIRDIGDVDFFDEENNVQNLLPNVTQEVLRKFDYIHPYMFKRKLTMDVINKFEVGYDKETDSLTFPVYVNGNCLFVARRRVSYKRFDMPSITPKPIYGLDYITQDEIIVCESIINALTCWQYGRQAVALFGTGSHEQIEQLKNISCRKLILALDGDYAGECGTKRILDQIQDKIVTVLDIPKGKDINDLTKEEFDQLEEKYFV